MKAILEELKRHAPFTALGAAAGILFFFFFQGLDEDTEYRLFYVLHPLHVFWSALVTASIYRIYQMKAGKAPKWWQVLLVGYIGSVGVCTISDSIIPFVGENVLERFYPQSHGSQEYMHVHAGLHLGFIEEWHIINPLVIFGILWALFKPITKAPHALHVFLSTWASLFHLMMAVEGSITAIAYAVIFLTLFLAVWIPCCFSDIVFPLLFIRDKKKCLNH